MNPLKHMKKRKMMRKGRPRITMRLTSHHKSSQNLSEEPTLKPRKKKTEKKGKVKNKSSEEVPSLEHAHDKENKKAKEK